MNHTEYAKRYNCSIAKAISDRDYPATTKQCVAEFVKETGRQPTASEIVEMHPDDQRQVDSFKQEIQQSYNSLYA